MRFWEDRQSDLRPRGDRPWTRIGWATALLEPLADAIGRHVLRGDAIFADDTPVKVLTPGAGKTKTARLWAYARDERPWAGDAPPAAWYQFSTDRKAERPRDHLQNFEGWMHADGYAGFEELYRSGKVHEVACMAHIRRKFVDVHKAQGSAIAEEAIRRIARLYAVEKEARGQPPDKRRQIWKRQDKTPSRSSMIWKHGCIRTTSPKDIRQDALAGAIRYASSALTRIKRLRRLSGSRHTGAGQHTPPSDPCARLPWAGRTIFLWAQRAAVSQPPSPIPLIETAHCKLNSVDPQAWLT